MVKLEHKSQRILVNNQKWTFRAYQRTCMNVSEMPIIYPTQLYKASNAMLLISQGATELLFNKTAYCYLKLYEFLSTTQFIKVVLNRRSSKALRVGTCQNVVVISGIRKSP